MLSVNTGNSKGYVADVNHPSTNYKMTTMGMWTLSISESYGQWYEDYFPIFNFDLTTLSVSDDPIHEISINDSTPPPGEKKAFFADR